MIRGQILEQLAKFRKLDVDGAGKVARGEFIRGTYVQYRYQAIPGPAQKFLPGQRLHIVTAAEIPGQDTLHLRVMALGRLEEGYPEWKAAGLPVDDTAS